MVRKKMSCFEQELNIKMDDILEDIKKLKLTILRHDRRICELEKRLAEKDGESTTVKGDDASEAASPTVKSAPPVNDAPNNNNSPTFPADLDLAPDEV